MDWVLRSPQIHSTFGSLGHVHAGVYHVNENRNAALETILQSILTEDKTLRPYRRSISFANNIEKDLIPLLVNVKDDKTIELLIKIVVNLSIPIECLFSVDVENKQTAYEINSLLASTKVAFTDIKAVAVIAGFLKKNLERDEEGNLSAEQCVNISNILLLLRNILHIPEKPNDCSSRHESNNSKKSALYPMQNKIIYNIFTQSIDKLLIKLMIIPEASNWAVTMVQLLALLYKDQHVATLHKLSNTWLNAAVSENTEDNESNMSNPGKKGSDPEKNDQEDASTNNVNMKDSNLNTQEFKSEPKKEKKTSPPDISESHCDSNKTDSANGSVEGQSDGCGREQTAVNNKNTKLVSENSDFGYGTQIETKESILTSSNEDEYKCKKPVHIKPMNLKQKTDNNNCADVTIPDKKRKKLIKRGKSNAVTVQEVPHKTPSDDKISNLLKEFTVDFLLKGYNSLVETLHNQILLKRDLEIDTSHFFWLVTYFLKFATQTELNLEHISSVLSFEVVSYLTAEGVNLCEQFELAIKLDKLDHRPISRRLHLIVTAIREFIQAIEAYQKLPNICDKSKDFLNLLATQVTQTEELRDLFLLLLQYYQKKYHSKQYLVDLIVTNHVLVSFLDRVKKTKNQTQTLVVDHIKQFAATDIMQQYASLLENYLNNEELVNECIFTLMHHMGAEHGSFISLFQPKILTTLTNIRNSHLDTIPPEWTDLIKYVLYTLIEKPEKLQNVSHIKIEKDLKDKQKMGTVEHKDGGNNNKEKAATNYNNCGQGRWTETEISSLTWNYMQFSNSSNVVSEITEQLKEDGTNKTRMEVISELYKQSLINQEQYKHFIGVENINKPKKVHITKEMRDDEIKRLCEQLKQDGKSKSLDWVQNVLLELCFAKICFEKKAQNAPSAKPSGRYKFVKGINAELLKENIQDLPGMSPVAWMALLHNQPLPLVPWTCEQSEICKDLGFLQLIHKFGFCMPVDTGKVFIRIPNIWTAEILFEMAKKLSTVDTSKLKFSLDDISGPGVTDFASQTSLDDIISTSAVKVNQIRKRKMDTTIHSDTPVPGSTGIMDTLNTAPSWLDIVKRSQNNKRSQLGRGLSVLKEVDIESPAGLPPLPVPKLLESAVYYARPDLLPVSGLSTYHDDGGDTDCNISTCDTVSVASDLTRMYVSDEDEKPDVFIAPLPRIRVHPRSESIAEDSASAVKRSRMQIVPPLIIRKKIRTSNAPLTTI